MSFTVDTGLDVTVITKEKAAKLGGATSPTGRVFTATDKSVLNILGKHKIKLASA